MQSRAREYGCGKFDARASLRSRLLQRYRRWSIGAIQIAPPSANAGTDSCAAPGFPAAPSASRPNPACTRLTQALRRRPQRAPPAHRRALDGHRDFRARAPSSRSFTTRRGNGPNRGSERDERRVPYREVAVTSVERVLNRAITGCIPWRRNT